MELVKALLLGIIQGLTEFLPISSSGHLVIGAELLKFNPPGISFEVFLHLGTLIAVVIAFHKDIIIMVRALFSSKKQRENDEALNTGYWWNIHIIIATLPAVFAGLFLKDSIEAIFNNILVTFLMLSVTGTIMLLTTRIKRHQQGVTAWKAFIIGIAQALAIFPGISRSGSTIFTGMLLGVKRETAARFSFIMSIPAILGAAVLKLGDLLAAPPAPSEIFNLAAGTAASTLSGYCAILVLMDFVRKGKLHWFGYYCFFVSFTGILWYILR